MSEHDSFKALDPSRLDVRYWVTTTPRVSICLACDMLLTTRSVVAEVWTRNERAGEICVECLASEELEDKLCARGFGDVQEAEGF
jgi:hypothetical protein